MKKFSVVIGTNYGDEGKGLTTDWLSSLTEKAAVVRFSGGANAGHTVELDDGTKHVFAHFGSGLYNNAPTILARDFIVNPILFWKEFDKLSKNSGVYIDPRCIVTTPMDVMLNQEKERIRNTERHGSTGVGINETVTRNECGVQLTVQDLSSPSLSYKIQVIREYFQDEMLKINPSYDFRGTLGAIERFMDDSQRLVKAVPIVQDEEVMRHFDHLVFEGSQGLMLDQDSEDFPHVTRASTGTTNLVKYFKSFPEYQIDLYYITRSYLTRHGAGPMPTECKKVRYIDLTNRTNEFQGELRFGNLDLDKMARVVKKDLDNLTEIDDYTINTMMTWFKDKPEHTQLSLEFASAIGANRQYVAYGKTRTSVKEL